jgi:hypothetical protein
VMFDHHHQWRRDQTSFAGRKDRQKRNVIPLHDVSGPSFYESAVMYYN